MAVHDDRIAMKPRSVVRRISSVLIPSTPKKYWTPMLGIHGCRSTNWNPSAPRSNQNHRGRLTRNPAKPKTFATHRTASSLLLNGGSSSTTAPTSGV